jgi:hypothetical protein
MVDEAKIISRNTPKMTIYLAGYGQISFVRLTVMALARWSFTFLTFNVAHFLGVLSNKNVEPSQNSSDKTPTIVSLPIFF